MRKAGPRPELTRSGARAEEREREEGKARAVVGHGEETGSKTGATEREMAETRQQALDDKL